MLGETSRPIGEAEVASTPDRGGAPVGGGSDDRPSFTERRGQRCQVCFLKQRQVAMEHQPCAGAVFGPDHTLPSCRTKSFTRIGNHWDAAPQSPLRHLVISGYYQGKKPGCFGCFRGSRRQPDTKFHSRSWLQHIDQPSLAELERFHGEDGDCWHSTERRSE